MQGEARALAARYAPGMVQRIRERRFRGFSGLNRWPGRRQTRPAVSTCRNDPGRRPIASPRSFIQAPAVPALRRIRTIRPIREIRIPKVFEPYAARPTPIHKGRFPPRRPPSMPNPCCFCRPAVKPSGRPAPYRTTMSCNAALILGSSDRDSCEIARRRTVMFSSPFTIVSSLSTAALSPLRM